MTWLWYEGDLGSNSKFPSFWLSDLGCHLLSLHFSVTQGRYFPFSHQCEDRIRQGVCTVLSLQETLIVVATERTRPEKESAVHQLALFQAALIEISNNIDQSEMKSKQGFQALSGSLSTPLCDSIS